MKEDGEKLLHLYLTCDRETCFLVASGYIFIYSLHLRLKQNTPNSHHDARAKAFFEILTPHLVKTKWISLSDMQLHELNTHAGVGFFLHNYR